jgi:hypothetical protein
MADSNFKFVVPVDRKSLDLIGLKSVRLTFPLSWKKIGEKIIGTYFAEHALAPFVNLYLHICCLLIGFPQQQQSSFTLKSFSVSLVLFFADFLSFLIF